MKTLRFGIIGCGMIAERHATAIRENAGLGAELTGVADKDYSLAERFAKGLCVKAFPGAEELMKSPDIDVVCICAPSGLHAPLAIAAAENGKHIVVEKPMALNVKDGESLIADCEKTGVRCEVISQLRFGDGVQAVKKVISEGKLGKLTYASADMKYYRSPEYYAAGGWRGTYAMDGGGALMNQGIHGVDILQYLAGGVKSVNAKSKTLIHTIETEDTLCAVLEFDNGALGHIAAATSAYPGLKRRIEISGDNGTVVLEETAVRFWEVKGCPMPENLKVVGASDATEADPAALSPAGHILQFAGFIRAIQNGGDGLVNGEEGLKPIRIINAIYESAAKGKEVFLNRQ